MKISNAIVIGGSITTPKHNLIQSFKNFIPVCEEDSYDYLQQVLLEDSYKGDIISSQVFQLDFMITRSQKYKLLANDKKTHMFERTIFEDYIFAKVKFGTNKNIWDYYLSIWKEEIDEMIGEIGMPKLYIILDLSWEEFKKRLFRRNRIFETKNFESKKEYFRLIQDGFKKDLYDLLDIYNVRYKILNINGMSDKEIYFEVEKIIENEVK